MRERYLPRMESPPPELDLEPGRFFWIGFALEASLGLLAALLGLMLVGEAFPFLFHADLEGLVWGLCGTVPLILFALLSRTRWARQLGPLRRIEEVVERLMGKAITEMSLLQIVLISVAAGYGEEALFRGVLERWLEESLTQVSAVLLSATLFGLLHPMTVGYFVLTFCIGIWFSWLHHQTGNLFVPAFAHALYDTLALLLFRRKLRREAAEVTAGNGETADTEN